MSGEFALPYPDPPLEDALVRLRRWEQRDVQCVQDGKGRAEQEARVWIERQQQRASVGDGLSLAITDPGTDTSLGYVGLIFRPQLEAGVIRREATPEGSGLLFRVQPGNAGIGYWMTESARGMGFASRAVGLLSRWAIVDAGLERIEALMEPGNTASKRVAERAGFRREGYLRSYLHFDGAHADAIVYSLVRGDLV